jgi:hypothetical protein
LRFTLLRLSLLKIFCGLRKISVGLVECRLKRSRIDRKEWRSFGDIGAVRVVLFEKL